jgi:hypothetical protein
MSKLIVTGYKVQYPIAMIKDMVEGQEVME